MSDKDEIIQEIRAGRVVFGIAILVFFISIAYGIVKIKTRLDHIQQQCTTEKER